MLKLSNIMDEYKELNNEAEKIIEEVEFRNRLRQEIHESLDKLEQEMESKEEYLMKFRKAKKYIQQITDDRNENVKLYMKDIIENGLATILENKEYEIIIEDDNRGDDAKITKIQLVSTHTGKPRKVGMAVKQNTSLLFIVVLLEIAKSSRMLALDEYLSGASGETASKLSDVITSLCKNNKFQFHVVNHVMEISDNNDFVRIYVEKNSDDEGTVVNKEKTQRDMDKRKALKGEQEERETGEV